MHSTHLTRQQADRLRLQVAARLPWLTRLIDRMQQRRFPPDDPVFIAALRAREAMQDLHVAAHYASCEHGIGRPEK